jgi:hypothetical protein
MTASEQREPSQVLAGDDDDAAAAAAAGWEQEFQKSRAVFSTYSHTVPDKRKL